MNIRHDSREQRSPNMAELLLHTRNNVITTCSNKCSIDRDGRTFVSYILCLLAFDKALFAPMDQYLHTMEITIHSRYV